MSFFDPLSFALGFGTATGIGVGLYAARERIPFFNKKSDDELVGGVSSGAIEVLSPQAGRRYLDDMTAYFNRLHLGGDKIALMDVLVEPRFLRDTLPRLDIEEPEEGVLPDPDMFRVIPFLHQFPGMYASFNVETIGLKDFESGNPHVAVLGLPGSGKSVALAAFGLLALGRLTMDKFRTPEDRRFSQDDPDDENLPEEVKERRRKEREEVQQRAIQQLRIVQRREEEAEVLEQRDIEVDFERLFPIYIHIRDVDLDPTHYGGTIDPTEPFIRALPRYVSSVTATVTAPLMYNMLKKGQALILIDGYDELLPGERETYYHWLGALLTHYGNNNVIITGPATGYDQLMGLGFAPSFIRPFTEMKFGQLLEKWLEHGDAIGNLPNEQGKRRLQADNRNRIALDVVMKIWATLHGDIQTAGRRGDYDTYVRAHLDEDIEHHLDILKAIAAYWLDAGVAPDEAAVRDILSDYMGAEGGSDDEKKKAESRIDKALRALGQNALLHVQPDGRYAPANPVIGWYLAAETLPEANQLELADLAHKPNWHYALGFAAGLLDLTPVVLQRLNSRSDLLFTNLFTIADWIPDAPNEVQWVKEVLKRLGTALLHPSQFPQVRSHAVAALVNTRDTSGGVTYVLRQAVRSGNANIRMLGCLGLGALGSSEAVSDLTPMLVDDVFEVQLAAGLSLGAIGTENALTPLVQALLDGEPRLRRAVAEALASIPSEGHAILLDAIDHPELEVRRAAVFGLARIPQTWALVALYRSMLEDSQWSVRNAAERAFAQAREPKATGPLHYPEPLRYNWLNAWASERGESVPEGANGRQVLMKALQEAPPKVRAEAARALGLLAHVPAVKALYATLTDKDADVRMEAFNALTRMSERVGKPLPGLV